MPEYVYPGVYVEEIAFAARPVSGVPTSTATAQPIDGSGGSVGARAVALRRPNFFAGRLLDTETLAAEQRYQRQKLRRQNRALLGSGVVSGLDVQVDTDAGGAARIVVAPGCAIDSSGEILVLECAVSCLATQQRDRAWVTLRYWEVGTSPIAVGDETIDAFIDEACVVAVTPDRPAGAVAVAVLSRACGTWRVDPAFVVPRVQRPG